jgi:hypothetical protein
MPLKGEKSHAYLHCLRRLEISYAMFSVNLDEAFGMRRVGKNSKAYQVLSVAPALCQRLAQPLACLLRIMLGHAKHFGITPNLAPLDARNFQNSRSQRVALIDDLLSRILFSRKSQFSHKISALAGLVDELGSSFEATAEELTSGDSLHPDRDWELLDSVHYDLNTCLREAVVLLKSFLHALPDPQLSAFQAALQDAPADPGSPVATASAILPIDGWPS